MAGSVRRHVGARARSVLVAGAVLALYAAGACGGTSGLILGAAPVDAGLDATVVASLDATAPLDGDAPQTTPVVLVADGDAGVTAQQGGGGGSPYVDLCPGDQVLVGYQGYLTPPSVGVVVVGELVGMCAGLGIVDGASMTTMGGTLPTRGMDMDDPWTEACPAGEVVVGFMGHSGSALDQIALVCAPWSALDGGALVMGPTDTLGVEGGDGGGAYAVACPTGELARGQSLRSGEWLDAFALVCATPVLGRDAGP